VEENLERMEGLIGRLLIIGVTVSAFIVIVGGVLYLIRHGGAPVIYQIFRGEPIDLRTIDGVTREARMLTGRGLIQFGLILLVAVQVLRVALTVWLFYSEQEWKFVGISLVVLAALVYSLFGNG
jgi:uncharacterized membrane protein